MFPLIRTINRRDLRSAGISRFIAKPLRSYRSPSLASASSGRLLLRWSTILGYYPFDPGCFTKNLWAFPRLAWLLHCRCQARCCLRPRGAENHSSLTRLPFRLRPARQDRRTPKIQLFSGLRGRFRAHTLHLARLAYLLLCRYTTGRLTKPYPGGLRLSPSLSTTNQSQVRTVHEVAFL